ncbi:MAG TPA: hypothetical protein VGQ17_15715 [Gemmatimonadales bacterium]|jgi:hypothetical protein|nr:hypothetical protein [Gemmatimonadales bacterium]
MRRYWAKIVLGALLVFSLGFGVLSAGRRFKGSVTSARDIRIPFGSFVPFKLDGVKVGTLRSLTIRRTSPREVVGFDLRVRLGDATALGKLQECNLSVSDPHRIDEHTTFLCLPSELGYQEFGKVTIDLQEDGAPRTVVLPLLLTEAAIREIQNHGASELPGPSVDSMASEVRDRVRAQARAYSDSVRAAELDRQAERMKHKADSLRLRLSPPTPAAGVPPKPTNP